MHKYNSFLSCVSHVADTLSVTATLVSKANAKGDREELQDAISQALVLGFYVALISSFLMLKFPSTVLSSVLKGELLQNHASVDPLHMLTDHLTKLLCIYFHVSQMEHQHFSMRGHISS